MGSKLKEKRSVKKIGDIYRITALETLDYKLEQIQAVVVGLKGQKKAKEDEVNNMTLAIPLIKNQIAQLDHQLKWLRKNIPKAFKKPEEMVKPDVSAKLT